MMKIKFFKILIFSALVIFGIGFVIDNSYFPNSSVIHKKVLHTTKKTSNSDVRESVLKKLNRYLLKIDFSVAISIYNNKTGLSYKANHLTTGKTFITASIVKVSFLMQGLHDRDFDENDNYLATNMIEYSDNDATNDFSTTLGGNANLQNLFDGLNMHDTHMGQTWGQTVTTSDDQLKLLNELVYNHQYLDATKSDYLLNLMNHVDDDQKWGVSCGVTDSSNVDLKNGWLTLDGITTVNSIGHVVDEKHDYTIAVLTQSDTKNIDEGIQLINHLSKIVYQELS